MKTLRTIQASVVAGFLVVVLSACGVEQEITFMHDGGTNELAGIAMLTVWAPGDPQELFLFDAASVSISLDLTNLELTGGHSGVFTLSLHDDQGAPLSSGGPYGYNVAQPSACTGVLTIDPPDWAAVDIYVQSASFIAPAAVAFSLNLPLQRVDENEPGTVCSTLMFNQQEVGHQCATYPPPPSSCACRLASAPGRQ